jgi:transposase
MQFEESFSSTCTEVFMAVECASKFHYIPEVLWERIECLLPKYRRSPRGGRPRLELRKVVTGILYVLRTGCQWKAMPREFGSGSAIHEYFQEWVGLGIFAKLWKLALEEYDELQGIDWEWQSLDGALTKAPLGGEKNRKKPDGSRQTWRQTIGAHRRRRCTGGRGDRWRQCA